MTPDCDTFRETLRQWIVEKSGKVSLEVLTDNTPLLGERIITSVQILDLILLLERLTGKPIDAEIIKPGVFKDVATIVANFCRS